MNWKSWLGPVVKLIVLIGVWVGRFKARRQGRLEQRNAQLEQDAKDARAAADAGRAVDHGDDAVLRDPENRDQQGDGRSAV